MPEEKESPYLQIERRSREAEAQVKRLAEELVQVLHAPRDPLWGQGNWLGLVERWESFETIAAALEVCLGIALTQDPFRVQNLSRQLRRWRREQGGKNRGWLEIRYVRGYGPYVYWRWRERGERKLHTEYYGKGETLVEDLAVMAHTRREPTDAPE